MTRDQPVLVPKPSTLATVGDSRQLWPRPTISLRFGVLPWTIAAVQAALAHPCACPLSSTVRFLTLSTLNDLEPLAPMVFKVLDLAFPSIVGVKPIALNSSGLLTF